MTKKLAKVLTVMVIIASFTWIMWIANIITKAQWTHTRESIATELFLEEEEYLRGLGYCTDVWYADMYENDRVYVCNLVMEDGNSFETVITKDCGNVYMLGYMDYIAPYWENGKS